MKDMITQTRIGGLGTMNSSAPIQVKAASTLEPSFTSVPTGLLHRKCACGQPVGWVERSETHQIHREMRICTLMTIHDELPPLSTKRRLLFFTIALAERAAGVIAHRTHTRVACFER